MAEVAQTQFKVEDPGIEEGLQKLTDEKKDKILSEFVAFLKKGRFDVYVNTCIHCGLCSDACHWYQSFKDPIYSPAGKVKQTIWEILRRDGKVDRNFIRRAAEIAFTECNLCKRCSMYCPFGIDIGYMMNLVRRLCHLLGVVPLYIQDTVNSHSATLNQMWVKQDEWIDTIFWQEDEGLAEIKNFKIPFDKEGADIMFSVIGPEPKFKPQLIKEVATLMTIAGVDFTFPSFDGWDNSDMAMYIGDFEICGRNKKYHFEAALKLKVKRIVMCECGHAFRSVYDVGNRWLGWKAHPIPVIHAIQLYYELLKTGKLKVVRKIKEPVTLHDPCNVVRGRGLGKYARYIIEQICEDFREMTPNGEHNFCCAAGGGVINCGPIWRGKRVAGNKVKAEQIKATGAKIVITPCHNCHSGIADIIQTYNLDVKNVFFVDLLLQVVEIPDHLKVE